MARRLAPTRLARFLASREIKAARLGETLRERTDGIRPDQKQLSRWTLGDTEPGRKWWLRILWALREITGDRSIRLDDIVELDPDDPAIWND